MFTELKKRCYCANMELPRLGLVLYTFGNVSCCDRNKKVFAIKPSGVDYDKLSMEDIVIVDFDGKKVEGALNPSSDTPTHAILYKSYEDIGAIVHTHSTNATAWAQACRDIPIYGTTHADHLAVGVPCTPLMEDSRIQNDYEVETGRQIINTFSAKALNVSEVEMVIVGGHGPFTWGRDEKKAVYNARVLEELARMAYLTETINPNIKELKQSIIQKHYNRKHGENSYYGQK